MNIAYEMRRILIYLAVLLSTGWKSTLAQEPEVLKLTAESKPEIQAQIQTTYDALLSPAPGGDLKSDVEVFQQVQTLKKLADDQREIVKQLAIFTVTTTSEGDSHVIGALGILQFLDLPPTIPIRALAPYLDTENPQLRGFVRNWFQSHDGGLAQGVPPLGSLNYSDYMSYVGQQRNRNEEVPAPFVEYIYERSPGQALLVFVYGNQVVDPLIPPQERERRRRERGEILLAEHIVSNAIWLKENDFPERFQAALPDATAELAKLAKHEEWWARLYVAYIMRQHPELRQPAIVQQLVEDPDPLVSKTATSIRQ